MLSVTVQPIDLKENMVQPHAQCLCLHLTKDLSLLALTLSAYTVVAFFDKRNIAPPFLNMRRREE